MNEFKENLLLLLEAATVVHYRFVQEGTRCSFEAVTHVDEEPREEWASYTAYDGSEEADAVLAAELELNGFFVSDLSGSDSSDYVANY